MSCNVYATSFDESARFYGELLGLRRSLEMGPDACFFEIAGRKWGLYLEGGYEAAPASERASRATFSLEVTSAGDLFRRLRAAGVEIVQDAPQDMGNATSWFQFRDPSGNLIEAIGPA